MAQATHASKKRSTIGCQSVQLLTGCGEGHAPANLYWPVSALALGGVIGMQLPPSAEHDPAAIAEMALNLGITYFDTAPSYNKGQSETNYGQVLVRRRKEVFLATKTEVTQTFFTLGHLGGELRDKDYPALEVMADILGGGFHSRLVQRVETAQKSLELARIEIAQDMAIDIDGRHPALPG